MDTTNNPPKQPDKAPVFGSWRGWYLLVIGTLVVVMVLLYLFSKAYVWPT